MEEYRVTIEEINESLCDLDTEYRESLAHCLVELKYLSDSPLQLYYGTEKQQKELKEVNQKPLNANQIKEIMNYISNEMKGDFQYGEFKSIAKMYINIAKEIEQEDNEELDK